MLLESSGDFSVQTSVSARDALAFLNENTADAIISDYSMPEMNGIEFLEVIRKRYPQMPFIILTGDDSKEIAINALNSGADFYQNKSERIDIQILDIAHKIRILTSQRDAERALRRKDAILEAISFAADQFLKEKTLNVDSRTILGRLGAAAEAEEVCLCAIHDSVSTGSAIYEMSAFWSRTGDTVSCLPSGWPEWWHQHLDTNLYLSGNSEDAADSDRHFYELHSIGSILILPIMVNETRSGYLIFINRSKDVRRSSIEIQTLRMAAEIIGSARYRKHIEEFYKSPVEEAILGVFLLCGKYFRYVNPRICSLFGYHRDELLRIDDPVSIIRGDEQQYFREHIRNLLEGKEIPHHFECTAIRKDGREIYLDMYLTVIRCQGIKCIAGNVIDVTERRMIQQSLLESEERYRRLAEQLDDLILVVTSSWKISYGNPAALGTFQAHIDPDITDLRDLFSEESYQGFYDTLQSALHDGSIRTWSMEITLPVQGTSWYDISITPLKGDDNQVSSLVIYFHDVSYRVQREEEIRRAGLAQLELNMEQFQILNDEIRNPLQVIKGYNLLQNGQYEKQIDEQLTIINDLIDKLDRAWVQSEKVHAFLLRHYQHGSFLSQNEDRTSG